MRILQLHSDYIEYKPIRKEIATAEEAGKEAIRLEEIVVIFIAVEEGDNEETAIKAIDEIEASIAKLGVNRILIYPYAHLSSNLAPPSEALKVIKAMESYAKKRNLEVYRAPFGWNKQFTISIKGHPLAEQSRHIKPVQAESKEEISEAIKAEEKLESFWFILQPDGEMIPVNDFNYHGHENLEKFMRYEISKVRASQQMPPHVPLMRRLEIADYEPGSDAGNIRWYPKGRLIKSLIEQYVTAKVIEYGAMEVETPVMYDFQHPSLADYINRFPARQYMLKSEDKELFLRFAACFGQFLMVHDAQFSYRHMPIKIYELTRYSFRREKSGEVVGLRRLRAFTMPDCHAFCTDLEQAKAEFMKRLRLSIEILEGMGLTREDYEMALRFTKDFYEENKEFILSIVASFGKPVLVEMWKEPFFYFRLKWEFNFVDNQDKAAALSTDQIDVENARRYGIMYVDAKGEKRYPLILHCSPSGAIERCIYALLEKAYRDQQKGKMPMFPVWLSPTQVRIIPMTENHLEQCEKIAAALEAQQTRVDIDDRQLTLQKRIREAEMEWIPYIIVVGQREIESGILPVRDRRSKEIIKMSVEELISRIKAETHGKPFKPLPLPKYVSKRPQFYG
ncbi:MAG: threonine--tRNA ligase [Candidatus Bathyarchaeota archaeon]|nr:threonine--tRNA ligase [Candidatus Bathyarchaeota archaeon]MCX8177925.1 threonine--tRNA ligase [Candidatus Bathyarchaeota archaeon]MDW8194254.1 threonine--tRNA ligase [Nitrososphaerota archaeon]